MSDACASVLIPGAPGVLANHSSAGNVYRTHEHQLLYCIARRAFQMICRVVVFSLLLASTLPVTAQQTVRSPVFDVVSIRPRSGDPVRQTVRSTPSRFIQSDVTLGQLIRYAYDLHKSQMSGGPNWIEKNRFEFIGVSSSTMSAAETRLMVRHALEDRFSLVARHRPREMPVYLLEVIDRNRQLGPQLSHSGLDCAAVRVAMRRNSEASPVGDLAKCLSFSMGLGAGVATLRFRGETMAFISRTLMAYVDRLVIDSTQLEGTFDGDLQIGMEYLPTRPTREFGETGPSLFTALAEQFGLKLVSQRRTADILMVEDAKLPTVN
jgi:uncharacterized protein (TIGR03435 family)